MRRAVVVRALARPPRDAHAQPRLHGGDAQPSGCVVVAEPGALAHGARRVEAPRPLHAAGRAGAAASATQGTVPNKSRGRSAAVDTWPDRDMFHWSRPSAYDRFGIGRYSLQLGRRPHVTGLRRMIENLLGGARWTSAAAPRSADGRALHGAPVPLGRSIFSQREVPVGSVDRAPRPSAAGARRRSRRRPARRRFEPSPPPRSPRTCGRLCARWTRCHARLLLIAACVRKLTPEKWSMLRAFVGVAYEVSPESAV